MSTTTKHRDPSFCRCRKNEQKWGKERERLSWHTKWVKLWKVGSWATPTKFHPWLSFSPLLYHCCCMKVTLSYTQLTSHLGALYIISVCIMFTASCTGIRNFTIPQTKPYFPAGLQSYTSLNCSTQLTRAWIWYDSNKPLSAVLCIGLTKTLPQSIPSYTAP